MNHVNPGATHKATSRFRAVAEHWLVAIMLGMVIGLLQAVFEPLAPLRVLEHIGGDMAMARVANQLEGRNWPAAPKLVLVRIDESAMRQWNATLGAQACGEIGRLVDRIRHAGASAVVLDITFDAPISGRDSATADNKLLRAVLASSDGAPLILAAPLVDKRIDGASAGRSRSNAMLLRLEPYPDRLGGNVRFASQKVVVDDDRRVRRVPRTTCVVVGDVLQGWPVLARAALEAAGMRVPDQQADCTGAGPEAPGAGTQASVAPDPMLGAGPFSVAAGATGLPLSWSGGFGPFRIDVADASNRGHVLGTAWTLGRFAIIDARLLSGGGDHVVHVTDTANGTGVSFQLRRTDAPSPAQGGGIPPLAEAAWLAEAAAPEWRLEGRRRMFALKDAGEAPAAEGSTLAPSLSDASQQSAKDWALPTGSYANTRTSALDQITPANAGRLQVAWTFSTGVLRGHQGAPLVVGDVMYLHTPFPNIVYALDLNNDGRIIWKYEPRQDSNVIPVMCCDTVNDGPAYADGKIILHQADTTLVALDAHSGRVVWSRRTGDYTKGETATGAPLVVRDKVYVGLAGGDFGVRGALQAFRLADGAPLWRAASTGPDTDMLVDPQRTTSLGRPVGPGSGLTGWQGDAWKTGGGTAEGWKAYDPELNLIFYGTGHPAPWNGTQRPGDNRWTSSVFARDADTGIARWVYQFTPHDEWNYGGVNEMMLVDQHIDGVRRRLLVHFDANSFAYVLDRASGALLTADKFDPIVNWASSVDLDPANPGYGRPVTVPAYSPDRHGEDANTPGVCPATLGAKSQPAAFSAQTGLFYIPTNHVCMDIEPFRVAYAAGQPYVGATLSMYPPTASTNLGNFLVWDALSGGPVWKTPTPFSVWSGALVTVGGVVFYGTLEGNLVAADARTGQELFRFKTPSGIIGNVMTYEHAGRQYVAVLSGVGGWAGIGLAAGLTDPQEGLGAVGGYAALNQYTQLGGSLTVFTLPPD